MPRLEGSRVSATGPEERGPLSDPHQIAVRAIYKISAEDEQRAEHHKNILASSIHRCHAREAAQEPAAFWAVNSTAEAGRRVRRLARLSLGFEENVERFTAPFEPMLLECGGLLRPGKTVGPSLLEPSLKVQGDSAHNPILPGSRSPRQALTHATFKRSYSVPRGISHRRRPRWCYATRATSAATASLRSDGARLSFEIYGGIWLRFVGKASEMPREASTSKLNTRVQFPSPAPIISMA